MAIIAGIGDAIFAAVSAVGDAAVSAVADVGTTLGVSSAASAIPASVAVTPEVAGLGSAAFDASGAAIIGDSAALSAADVAGTGAAAAGGAGAAAAGGAGLGSVGSIISGASSALAAGLTLAGTGAQLAAGQQAAAGAKQAAAATAQADTLNSQIAAQNAALAATNAGFAGQMGAVNVGVQGQKNRAIMGGIIANEAASGVDVNSGSYLDVQTSARELGQLNSLTLASNAAREAFGYEVQETGFKTEQQLNLSQAQAALAAGNIQAGATILNSVGSATDNFAKYLQSSGNSIGGTVDAALGLF